MRLKGKKAWIVGASGAIGSVVMQKFKDEGAIVSATRIDVCNWEEMEKFAQFVRPNILVNCAGILGPVGPTHNVAIDAWLKTIEVNLIGSFYLTQAVLPYMINAGEGKIIHFSGGGACEARPNHSAYAVSKTGLVRFVETVAEEIKSFNVQINAIAPGSVKSKMNPDSAGTPDRAAELAVFLVSDKSNGLTGRLISAIHDRWEFMEINGLSEEGGRLRRIPLND